MNKKARSVLMKVLLLVSGVFFITCTPPIEGDFSLIVKLHNEVGGGLPSYSPCWSSDGSLIYFITSWDTLQSGYPTDQVWSISVLTGSLRQITYQECIETGIHGIDISKEDNRCITYWPHGNGKIYVFETETWEKIDSILPVEESQPGIHCDFYYPKFSYESNEVAYYLYHILEDSSYLRKVSFSDSTDDLILTVKQNWFFAPGPGDTLFAIGDTIFNSKTNERIPINIDLPTTGSVNWNPANSSEVIISTGIYGDVYIFNLESSNKTRLDIRLPSNHIVNDARYSPDGERIVLEIEEVGDGTSEYGIWIFTFEE